MVWARMNQASINLGGNLTTVHNGGFEDRFLVGDQGFYWHVEPNLPNIVMSVDDANHQSGARSLRIDFRGDSDPQSPFLTQLVLVAPEHRYRMTFFARAREMVSAGLPVITIKDASNPTNMILAQTTSMGSDFADWRELNAEFTTGPQATAVTIIGGRQSCAERPCPAFGTLWLDSFSIEPVGLTRDADRAKKD